jgi:4-hydroxybenzoate polyprenyltransferase
MTSKTIPDYQETARPISGGPIRTVVRCLAEARPMVQLMVLLRFAAAALLSGVAPGWRPGLGCAAMLLTSTAVYLVNGLTDLPADIANGSRRPLARGDLTVRHGQIGAWSCGSAGLLLGLAAGPLVAGCAIAMAVAGLCYSCGRRAWKNRPAAAAAGIAVLGASTYLAGAVGAGSPHRLLSALLLGLVMTAWMSLVGAQAKDFSDAFGDVLAGRFTAAGGAADRALRRRVAAAALAIALTFCLLAVRYAAQLIWPAAALLLSAGVVAALALRGSSSGSRARTRRPYRAFMVGQYIANLLAIAVALNL